MISINDIKMSTIQQILNIDDVNKLKFIQQNVASVGE